MQFAKKKENRTVLSRRFTRKARQDAKKGMARPAVVARSASVQARASATNVRARTLAYASTPSLEDFDTDLI
jgi:hypothetical protein